MNIFKVTILLVSLGGIFYIGHHTHVLSLDSISVDNQHRVNRFLGYNQYVVQKTVFNYEYNIVNIKDGKEIPMKEEHKEMARDIIVTLKALAPHRLNIKEARGL